MLALLLLGILLLGLTTGAVAGGLAATALGRRAAPPAERPARAWVGITYIPITEQIALARGLPVARGALVVTVTPAGPADTAGLQDGDIITSIDAHALDDTTGLLDVLREAKPGDRVQMAILRDGAAQAVEIVIGRSPARAIDPGRAGFFEALRRNVLRLFGH